MAQAAKAEQEKPAEDTLRIWRSAQETDPNFTKPANFGRKMTAIDSYYQIKRATEMFGPWGQGWGYTSEEEIVIIDGTPMAKVRMILWYMDEDLERVQCSPITAMNRLVMGEKGVDEEAFKKATTDALTKSFSYLGFSADIFMGMFDDHRYVADLRKKYGNTKQVDQADSAPKLSEAIAKAVAEVKKAKTQDEFTKIKAGIKAEVEKMTDTAAKRYVALQFRAKEVELWPEMPEPEPTERMADAAA